MRTVILLTIFLALAYAAKNETIENNEQTVTEIQEEENGSEVTTIAGPEDVENPESTTVIVEKKPKTKPKKIVCYFGSWAVYRPGKGKFAIEYTDPKLCTHLIYTFVGLTEGGNVRILDPWADLGKDGGKNGYNKWNDLKKRNPKVKTMVAIGGWNEGSVKYSKVVGDPSLRKKFVENVVSFVKKYNFDGFDFDWEYPNQRGGKYADKKNYVETLKLMRERFDQEGLILSAAVGAAEVSASQSYLIAEVAKYLHFINLMAYDLHGQWDKKTGINAPLYPRKGETGAERKLNVNASVHYWLENGAPAEKIIVGIPFYGRSFTLNNAKNNKIGAPASSGGRAGPYSREPGNLGYNEICEMQKQGGWKIYYQKEQEVPYAYKGDQWVGYDGPRSIKKKAEYINELGLGGAMIWSIETDDFLGVCGEKYPLLTALNSVLKGKGESDSDESYEPEEPSEPEETPVDDGEVESNPVDEDNPVDLDPVEHLTMGPNDECVQEGYMRSNDDCSQFYYCESIEETGQFRSYHFDCPAGLYFDEKLLVCNWPDDVNCNVAN